jgi:hypothetical protein
VSNYLEEAAALLRKASDENEKTNRMYAVTLIQGRERIAGKFAQLAAIEKGLLPESLVMAEVTR